MSSWTLSPRRRWFRAAFAAGLALGSAALASDPRSAAAAEKGANAAAPGANGSAAPGAKAAAKPAPGKSAAKATPSAAKPADRERARQLVLEGDGFYERRELEQALDRYSQAYRLMHVPTVGIEVIKAQTALGKLVEAQATAEEVASAPKQRGEPAVFEEARQRAAQSNLRLTALIPSLWLEVSPSGVMFEVEIDGAPPASPPPYRLNPGAHQVRVKASGYQTRLLAITLREAERLNRRAELLPERAGGPVAAAASTDTGAGSALAAASAPSAAAQSPELASAQSVRPAPAQAAAAEPSAAAGQPADRLPPAGQGSVRTLGWVSLGIAAVAAGAGTYAGIRAFSTKPDCPNDTCVPSQQEDLDLSTRMGTIANVSVGVAVVTGVLGIWALASGGEGSEHGASFSELPVTVGLGKLNEIRVSGRF